MKHKSYFHQVIKQFRIVLLISFFLLVYSSLKNFNVFPTGFPIFDLNPRDIINATLTFIGICIAFFGLNTWKKQLTGKYDFDLACQTMRDIANIHISYNNFSNMWIFYFTSALQGKILIRLEMLDDYFLKLNEFRSSLNKFRVVINEIDTWWKDFPDESKKLMVIKANEYLAQGEKFISYCQSEMNVTQSKNHQVSFDLLDSEDSLSYMFLDLCSDILIDQHNLGDDVDSTFRKNYVEFVGSYERIRLYLKKKIENYISAFD